MKLIRPVGGDVTSEFGDINPKLRDGKPHAGVDFGVAVGTAAVAAFDGKVVLLKNETEGTPHEQRAGKRLGLLSTDKSLYALYFHLSEFLVPLGSVVKAGEVVAETGNTGHSTGPHLHFELRDKNGKAIKPEFYEENESA